VIKREERLVAEIVRRIGSPPQFAPDDGFKIVPLSRKVPAFYGDSQLTAPRSHK